MSSTARAARRLALPAAVACVVLGIFLMHGAGLHGVTSAPARAAAGAAHHGSHEAPAPASDDRGPAHHDDGGSHGSGAMATCVALVSGGLAALLLLALARAGHRPHAWLVVRRPTVGPLPRLLPPTGAGPPAAWRFSVIRC
jgi:hypothetical protein